MNQTASFKLFNIAYLQQGIDLLHQLDDQIFTRVNPALFESSIGAHFRHTLEHYTSLLRDVESGAIDYDARDRDYAIENFRTYAITETERIIAGLQTLPDEDCMLRVKLDGDDPTGTVNPWSQASLKRELQYLMAHTVHHYALIAFILRSEGITPSASFGVAPSTLQYRRTQLESSN